MIDARTAREPNRAQPRAQSDGNEPGAWSATDWYPSRTVTLLWQLVGGGLFFLGVGLFAAANGGDGAVAIAGWSAVGAFAATLALLLLLLVLHEAIHGAAMRRFGARPTYGVGVIYRLLPYFYCTAAGFRFTQRQFIAVSLTPLLIVSLLGALVVAVAPVGGWLVVPLAAHLGGCIGDLWGTALTLRQPPGTLVEDLKTGMRFYRPAAPA